MVWDGMGKVKKRKRKGEEERGRERNRDLGLRGRERERKLKEKEEENRKRREEKKTEIGSRAEEEVEEEYMPQVNRYKGASSVHFFPLVPLCSVLSCSIPSTSTNVNASKRRKYKLNNRKPSHAVFKKVCIPQSSSF